MQEIKEENKRLKKQTVKAVSDLEKLEIIVYGPKLQRTKKKSKSSKS